MPAFDVTAVPAQLTLKQGSKGTVAVTVTNKLSRAVTARADAVIEPASAAAWFTPPPEIERRFNSPQATEQFQWQVAIPANAPASSVTFRVDVVDIEAKEDNYGKSNAVAITVPAVAAEPVVQGGGGVPKWIWAVVALVVIGAGIAVWKLAGGKTRMPDLVGKPFSESALPAEKMVVQRVDSLAADTVKYQAGSVITQSIAPETELKGTKEKPDTVRLVVQKDFTVIPADLVNGSPVDAASKLGMAGLNAKAGTQSTADQAGVGKVLATSPAPGSLAVRGDTVTINVGYYCAAPCVRVIYTLPDATIRQMTEVNRDRYNRAGANVRDHRRRPPGGE